MYLAVASEIQLIISKISKVIIFENLRGVDTDDLYDPCVEYKAKQKVRREVMFAQRSAARGYRGDRYSRSPC